MYVVNGREVEQQAVERNERDSMLMLLLSGREEEDRLSLYFYLFKAVRSSGCQCLEAWLSISFEQPRTALDPVEPKVKRMKR